MRTGADASKRPVLVTGASRGIGRSIAFRLALAGHPVSVHCVVDRTGAETVAADIMKAGGCARVMQFDVSDRAAAAHALASAIERDGAFWGAVLNAGIARDNAFPALTDEDWDTVLSTNLGGFYNVLHPLVMPMVQLRDGGRIVTLSSASGLLGNRGQVNYSAAKAGIIGATKALAVELAKRRITVNCIAPGLIETAMTANVPLDEIKDSIPMRRLGTPDEVAAIVEFLFCEDAGYITRQVISVNGGLF